MSLILVKVGYPDNSPDNTLKRATTLFGKTIAVEFGTKRINTHVHSILPRFVRTPSGKRGMERLVEDSAVEKVSDVEAMIGTFALIGRVVKSEEIAKMAVFLVSGESGECAKPVRFHTWLEPHRDQCRPQ